MHRTRLLLPILAAAALGSCATGVEETAAKRPKRWAQPVEVAGVPNLHRVGPQLYRSAQPTAEGMAKLRKMGVKTVVSLRYFGKDEAPQDPAGPARVNIPVASWNPSRKDADRFLETVSDPEKGPFLVHCYHGADRTGTMCAIYRVRVQGWEPEEAIDEMTRGGFGFHTIWGNLPDFVRRQTRED